MSSNSLALLITDLGSKQLKALVEKGSVISLSIAIGDGDKVPSKETTALANQREMTNPTLLSAIGTSKNSWHINANFKPSENEFDITEIGLFINEEHSKEVKTLLGVYFEKNGITKKMSKTDLLIDIVVNLVGISETINWQDYQPSFSLPEASSTGYGTVKFATASDIQEKTPGLALATDNLSSILDNQQLKPEGATWKIIHNSTLNEDLYKPIGLFTIQDIIYGLMIKSNEVTSKDFLFISYNMDDTLSVNAMSSRMDAVFSLESSACGFKNGKISWLVFKDPSIAQNSAWQLQTPIAGTEKNATISDRIAFPNKDNMGSLLFYNQRACVIGGIPKASAQLLIGNTDENDALSLAYPRKNPLVHVIQDKIYCIGGTNADQPAVEVHSISFIENKSVNHSRFVPEMTAKLNLNNTEGFTSCVFKNRIYIFKVANYHKESQDLSFHYYDYLSNNWQSSMIPKNFFENNEITPSYGKAISDGLAIYIFCTQRLGSKTQLSIIKFTPN